MAKLNLNNNDRENIMSDIRAFVHNRYENETVLGEEYKENIATLQAIVDKAVKEFITPEEFAILIKHDAITNDRRNYGDKEATCDKRFPHIIGVESDYHKSRESKRVVARLSLDKVYSHSINKYTRFTINAPRIVDSTNKTWKKISDYVQTHANKKGKNGNSVIDHLWISADRLGCEAGSIISGYEKALKDVRTWEQAVEEIPGLEVMVNEETLAEIRDSKAVKKVSIDKQAEQFAKELVASKKNKE